MKISTRVVLLALILYLYSMEECKVRCDEVLPSFSEPVPNVTIPAGRDVDIPCVVENLGFNRVAWIKVETKAILSIHDHVITRNYRISLSHVDSRNFVLHIKNVKESDRGGYMCQLNTAPMMSQVGYLDVVFPPQIQRENTSSDIITTEGSNVTLTCVAKGYPTPNITWRREDGQPIVSMNNEGQLENDSKMVGESLFLIRVDRHYNGAYLCIAMNGVPPSVSQRILLQVYFPPEIMIKNNLIGAHFGTTALLKCYIQALPFPNIVWKKDGKIISSGKKYEIDIPIKKYKIETVLRIRDIQLVDFGIYRCTVNNSLGQAEGEVQIYDIPKPTSVPTLTLPTLCSTTMETSSWNDIPRSSEPEKDHGYFPKESVQTAKEESSPLYDDTNIRESKSIKSEESMEASGGNKADSQSVVFSASVCGLCVVLSILNEVIT
ncbi:lachesin-like [Limulus polyphemus]|uniref:Lachesin-like n=1 Tax=Limulus polyphemus TaxID=6850 RepID=A0ABM1S7I9_LIMPO|nr:lachesin-like [Limulus polyphemus]